VMFKVAFGSRESRLIISSATCTKCILAADGLILVELPVAYHLYPAGVATIAPLSTPIAA
jgi:hypothetical protein